MSQHNINITSHQNHSHTDQNYTAIDQIHNLTQYGSPNSNHFKQQLYGDFSLNQNKFQNTQQNIKTSNSYILQQEQSAQQQQVVYSTVETTVTKPVQKQTIVQQPPQIQSFVQQPAIQQVQTVVQQPAIQQVQTVVQQPVQLQSVVQQPIKFQSVVQQPVQYQTVQQPVKVQQVVQQPIQYQTVQQPVQIIQRQQPDVVYVNSSNRVNIQQDQQVLEKTIVKTEYVENTEKLTVYIQEIELLNGLLRDKNNQILEQNKQIEFLEQKVFNLISSQNNQTNFEIEIKKSQDIHITLNQEIADLRLRNNQLQGHINQYNIAIMEFDKQKQDLINQIQIHENNNINLDRQLQLFIIQIKDKDEIIKKLEDEIDEQKSEIDELKNRIEDLEEQKDKAKRNNKKGEDDNQKQKKRIQELEENEEDLKNKIRNFERIIERYKENEKVFQDKIEHLEIIIERQEDDKKRLQRDIQHLERQLIIIKEEAEPQDNIHYQRLKEEYEKHIITIVKKEQMITDIAATIKDYEERIIILTKTIMDQDEKNKDQERQLHQYQQNFADQSKLQGTIQQHLAQFVLVFTEIDSLRERNKALQEELDLSKRENIRLTLHQHSVIKYEQTEVEIINESFTQQKILENQELEF